MKHIAMGKVDGGYSGSRVNDASHKAHDDGKQSRQHILWSLEIYEQSSDRRVTGFTRPGILREGNQDSSGTGKGRQNYTTHRFRWTTKI